MESQQGGSFCKHIGKTPKGRESCRKDPRRREHSPGCARPKKNCVWVGRLARAASPVPRAIAGLVSDVTPFDCEGYTTQIKAHLEEAREVDMDRVFPQENYAYHYKVKSLESRTCLAKSFQEEVFPSIHHHQIADVGEFIRDDVPCDFDEIAKRAIHLGSGTYGHGFRICPHESCITDFSMKLIPYGVPDTDYDDNSSYNLEVTNTMRGENVDILQQVYLSRLLLGESLVSPHISLPVMGFRCSYNSPSIKYLIQKIPMYKRNDTERTYRIWKGILGEDQEDQDVEEKDQKILVFVSEYARHRSLYDWLKSLKASPAKHDRALESMGRNMPLVLFQIFFTYAAIQQRDPSFRHNDLHTKNILVQGITIPDRYANHVYHYHYETPAFGHIHFLVPITEFSIRLWDMDFANSESVPNRKVSDGTVNYMEDYGIIQTPCLQYDIAMLCIDMYSELLHHEIIPDIGDLPIEESNDREKLARFLFSWFNLTTTTPLMRGGVRARQTDYILHNRLTAFTQNNLDKFRVQVSRTKKMPYRDYTAEYCLYNTPIFQPFRASPEEVEAARKRGHILADYG